jgi:hypothetical protein
MESVMTKLVQIKTIKQAEKIVGGFSNPSKMPGYCLSLSAEHCNVGSKLRKVAGSICSDCYACKGRYIFPGTKVAQERRLAALDNPQWIEAMVFAINKRAAKHPEFRWHDSGDLQSLAHLEAIVEVAKLTPTVKHWLPTKEYQVVVDWIDKHGAFPANLCVRISATMKGRRASCIDGLPTSTVDCEGGFDCPVKNGSQTCDKNSSGKACRACFDKSVHTINYASH